MTSDVSVQPSSSSRTLQPSAGSHLRRPHPVPLVSVQPALPLPKMQIRAILQSQILVEHRRQVVNINPTVLAPFSFVLGRLSHGEQKRNRLRGEHGAEPGHERRKRAANSE
nr:hypothetical protein Itr_chr10CG08280 [Ipomoea trifida]